MSERSYDHPRDRILLPVADEVKLFSDTQEQLVAGQLEKVLPVEQALHAIGEIALKRLITMDRWEVVHLTNLGIIPNLNVNYPLELPNTPDARDYLDLAGNPEAVAEFMNWFMTKTLGAKATRATQIIDGEGRVVSSGMLNGMRGFAVANGLSLHPGNWDDSQYLDERTDNALDVLSSQGVMVQKIENPLRTLGRQKLMYKFDSKDPSTFVGFHIVRERDKAYLSKYNHVFRVSKSSESFVAAGNPQTDELFRVIMRIGAVAQLHMDDAQQEWILIDNAELASYPPAVQMFMSDYRHSIHDHDSPTLNITPISTAYVLHKPEK